MAKSKTYEMLLKIAGKADGSLKAACSAAEKDLATLGDAAKAAGTVAATALAGIATAAAGVAAASVKTGMEFDSAMSQVSATMGLTAKDIQNNVGGAGDTFAMLREKALEMGSATKFTSQEAAEGLNILAMSGYDAKQSVDMIEDVLHLAAAGSMDMASAAGYVSGAMKGFADDTKSAQYYADLMAKGATLANTDVAQLGEALSGSSATAKSYGQSADTVTLSLLRLAEQGEIGSAASTALAAAMKNLYAPTDQAAKLLQELGVNAFDPITHSARDFNDVVNELDVALSGYSDQQKTAYAQTIFGIQGFDAYNKMVVTSTEKQEEWAKALKGASGEAARQYETMTDNLAGDIDKWNSALDGIKIAISDRLTPYIREGLEYLTNNVLPVVAEKAGEIIPMIIEGGKALWENRNTILAVGGAVMTAVGAFKGLQVASAGIGAVKNLSTILGAASKNGNLLAKVLGMGNVKLALIAGVIALVAAGFVLLWNKSEKFRETVMVLWGQLQALGGAMVNMANIIWEKMAPLLEKLGSMFLNGLERASELLKPVISNIIAMFYGLTDFVIGAFSGDWDRALSGLDEIFWQAVATMKNLAVAGFTAILEIGTFIWPAIDNAVRAGIAAISSRFPVLGAVLASLWATVQKVWSNIQVILQNAIQFIENVFEGNWSAAWQNVVNIFGAIFSTVVAKALAPMDMLASGVQAAINSVAAFLQEKFPFLGALFSGWAASISAAIENIKAIFSGIIDFVQNVFTGNWSGAWQNIVDIFGNLFGMIVNLAKAPINGVISAINFVLEKINGISVTIPDWVPGVGGATLGFSLPTIPQLATGGIVTAPTILEAGEGGEPEAVLPLSKLSAMLQDEPEEAPLSQLAKMLDDWTKNNKPGPQGPSMGGAGSTDYPELWDGGGNDSPPPEGSQNPPGGGVDTITFAPVLNFYGPTTPEQAKKAGQISFAEFKRLYQQMKAEERRKNLRAPTH